MARGAIHPTRRRSDRAGRRWVVGTVAVVALGAVVADLLTAAEPWVTVTGPVVGVGLLAVLGLIAADRIEPERAGRWIVASLAVVFLGGFITQLLGSTPQTRDVGALAFRAVTTVVLLSGAAYVALGPRAGRLWSAVMLVVWFVGSAIVFRWDAELSGRPADVVDLAEPVLRATAVVVAVIVLFDLGATVAVRLASRATTARAVVRATARLAYHDDLTALPNRRAARQRLEAIAGDTGGSIVLVDLDHFKQINDQHGHAEGDRILQNVGTALQSSLRDEDLVGRWGGEEFLVVVTAADAGVAARVAKRCRGALRAIDTAEPVTASFGIAELVRGEHIDDALRRADDALYAAKEAGRDRIVVADPPLEVVGEGEEPAGGTAAGGAATHASR